jgi:ketosteroid isomerase-like protein
MSRANIELVRLTYDAFNREGMPGTLPYLDAAVEWDESDLPARPPGPFRGHEGLHELERLNAALWLEIRAEVDDIIDAGDNTVVAFLRAVGKGRFTGEPVELTIAHLWDIRDGKGVRVKLYLDRQEAMEAAGLS